MIDYKEFQENVKHGTTTVGLVCSDGVVMGADVRATAGSYISSSEAIKIHKINETLAITIAGGVGDAEYLVKLLKMQNEFYRMEESKNMTPSSATSILSIILQESKVYPYFVELILGGLNKGTPEIYDIDPVGGHIKESRYTATGSGAVIAVGYIESIYTPDMLTQDAVKHAAKALKIAMKRDSATGDGVRIVAITKKGYKEYSREDIERMLK